MIGFVVMMSGMLVLAAAVSYWISWDMKSQDERLSFVKTVYGDLAFLVAKWRNRAANDRAARSQVRQSVEETVRSASPALSRS
jgi:hypothetical protein